MRLRARLNRYHVWLGWLIGVPLLFWTVSGLFMAAFPIEDVRGAQLRAAPAMLSDGPYIFPIAVPPDAMTITVEQQATGPHWIIETISGTITRADAKTGAPLAPVDEPEARAIARASYAGTAALSGATAVAAADNPLDLRSGRPAWQLRYDDGTNVYVDADSGRLLAVRTPLWRAYDWMWGLHIMDLQERDHTHHPLLYGFAALSLIGVILGLVLLPMTGRRRRKRTP